MRDLNSEFDHLGFEVSNLKSATIQIWNLQSDDGQLKRFVSSRSSPRPVHTESNTVARKP